MIDEVNDKIDKLWNILMGHHKELIVKTKQLKTAIGNKDTEEAGAISGAMQMIAQSNVTYTLMIEVLEDLKKTQGVGG